LEAEKAVKEQMIKDAKAKRKIKRDQWVKDHPKMNSFYNGAKETLKKPGVVVSLITVGIVVGVFGYAASKSR
jgi:hypothetical protein